MQPSSLSNLLKAQENWRANGGGMKPLFYTHRFACHTSLEIENSHCKKDIANGSKKTHIVSHPKSHHYWYPLAHMNKRNLKNIAAKLSI